MWLKWCLCFLLLHVLIVYCHNSCTDKTSCRECISTPSCHWCIQPVGDKPHCVATENAVGDWCPRNKEVKYITKYEVVSQGNETAQIHPQKATLKLRLGEESDQLKIHFKLSKNYPIDLYYLMDLSNSMKDDKDKLSTLGVQLSEVMSNITRNFRLGFGSFVDKVAMPFVSIVPSKLEHPCTNCTSPYSFKNHLALNDDARRFSEEVNKAEVSGNLDSPEGGFDALMQAMVCTKEINWREKARHLLVFSTDASFHVAGDGKLAGVVEPNDGLCHLNKKGEYTHALEYDYPSISQLNEKAKENNIHIIFAVAQNQKEIYESLTKRISGSSRGTLSTDSSNVISLILDQYDKIVDTVTMTDNADRRIEIRYHSKCLGNEETETNICNNLSVGNAVDFTIKIKVVKCPNINGSVWKQTLQFKPQGINDTLELNLEVYCGCPCEFEGPDTGYVKNSSECHYYGALKCGVCECVKGRTGHECECSENDFKSKQDDTPCTNETTGFVCSNRGTCKCGVCSCVQRTNKEEIITGKFCECDNFSCDRYNLELCNGKDKGVCKCGKCECFRGWEGPACQYVNDHNACMNGDKVCSGNGKCEHGKCLCDEQYTGKLCEECPLCEDGKCKELADCVECLVYGEGKLADTCDCNYTIAKVEKLQEKDKGVDEHICRLPDQASCTFTFIYHYNNGILSIRAQKEKECPGPGDVLGVVLGIIGTTVILGLLIILIWKLLTTLHDRREYAKFEKERSNAKFDRGQNPIYKGAVTKFDNPTFSGN